MERSASCCIRTYGVASACTETALAGMSGRTRMAAAARRLYFLRLWRVSLLGWKSATGYKTSNDDFFLVCACCGCLHHPLLCHLFLC